MRKNIEEAKRALTEKPIMATSVERFKILNEVKSMYKELPQPNRFSKILNVLLSRVSVPLEKYDLIAGRSVDRELNEEEEAEFQRYLKHPDYPGRRLFFASGRCIYSWEMLVSEGLGGLKGKVLNKISEEKDEDKKIFLSSVAESYDAIISYILRYADASEKSGNSELSGNLREIAMGASSSFASALQLLWIITLIDCAYISENPTLTVGRLDKLLYPYYKADIESGKITRERAKEYITDYYCKHNLIMGRSEHSWPEDFMIIARELAGREEGSVTIDDFYNMFFDRMAEFIDRKLKILSCELSIRKRKPSSVITFGDCFFEGSINSAKCFSAGAKYHFELQAFQMFGTVADCFIAVDQLVMIEKRITLKRLVEAADSNFEGYPDVLALMNSVH